MGNERHFGGRSAVHWEEGPEGGKTGSAWDLIPGKSHQLFLSVQRFSAAQTDNFISCCDDGVSVFFALNADPITILINE